MMFLRLQYLVLTFYPLFGFLVMWRGAGNQAEREQQVSTMWCELERVTQFCHPLPNGTRCIQRLDVDIMAKRNTQQGRLSHSMRTSSIATRQVLLWGCLCTRLNHTVEKHNGNYSPDIQKYVWEENNPKYTKHPSFLRKKARKNIAGTDKADVRWSEAKKAHNTWSPHPMAITFPNLACLFRGIRGVELLYSFSCFHFSARRRSVSKFGHCCLIWFHLFRNQHYPLSDSTPQFHM